MADKVKKVVLAYSGGLDTSVIIPWLKEHYDGCEVIACCADVGQGDELSVVHDKALKSGASKVYIEDVKEEFLKEYVWPTLKAGAVYEDKYLLGTSFARPLIAKKLVEVAKKEGADAIAHGATGKGNDQVRFELTVKALAPHIKLIAPWREWDLDSRSAEIEYAKKHGIPIATENKTYSMDRNIWHLSHEGSDLEDPANEPHDSMFLISKAPQEAPDKPEYVTIDFEKGEPVAVNGKKLDPVALLTELNEIGARNGVGIVDICENRLVGMKSRGVYENPGSSARRCRHSWTARSRRSRARSSSSSTRAALSRLARRARILSTARNSSRSSMTTSTTRPMRRASSTCSACRCRCVPSCRRKQTNERSHVGRPVFKDHGRDDQ